MTVRVSGTCLEAQTRTIQGSNGPFDSTTLRVLSGKASVEEVRAGFDFKVLDLPREGEECDLECEVRAWADKNGGVHYGLTAIRQWEAKPAGLRAAPPAPVSKPA